MICKDCLSETFRKYGTVKIRIKETRTIKTYQKYQCCTCNHIQRGELLKEIQY